MPEPQTLDLVLLAQDTELEDATAPLVDPSLFRTTTCRRASDIAATQALRPHHTLVLLVSHCAPETAALQCALDTCERVHGATLCITQDFTAELAQNLWQIGVQEVLPFKDVTPARLREAALASLVRARRYRDLGTARDRHSHKWSLMAALAAADTQQTVLQHLSHGLLALGATGVVCWQSEKKALRLLHTHGTPIERLRPEETIFDADHPANECVRASRAFWHSSSSTLSKRFGDFVPEDPQQALGFIPLGSPHTAQFGLTLAYDALPSSDTQREIEQCCRQGAIALARAARQTELLKERDEARRMLRVVGHDIRNPLGTVALSLEYFANLLPKRALPILNQVQHAVRMATHLTHDLLTFTEMTGDRLRLTPQPCDVFELVQRLVPCAQRWAHEGRTICLETLQGDGQAAADPVRLEQVLSNLLFNALTHARPADTIKVRGHADAHAVYLEVENRGARLDAESAPQVFAPLQQLKAPTALGSQGLGLFIVERIMAAHGGKVWLEPFEHDGVRFCLQIPRELPTTQSAGIYLTFRAAQAPCSRSPTQLEEPLERLAAAFKDPSLRRLLCMWREARGGQHFPPHPQAINQSQLLGYQPDMVRARLTLTREGEPVFEWLEVGPKLERRLGYSLRGESLSPTEKNMLALHYAAYQRCWRHGEPVYDYTRQRGAHPFSFERLLLPFSRDANHAVTEILGLILFEFADERYRHSG